MNFRIKILIASLIVCAADLPAMDFWLHPEIAGKNTVFVDVGVAPLVFTDFEFPVLPLELRLDYVPPFFLPVSFGLFMKTPHPNLKSFGTRVAWHFNLRDSLTDLFLVHVFDFGFIRNNRLEQFNDTPVEVHYFDFRVGARRFFGQYVGIAVESDFKVFGIILMLSIKLN